MNDQNIEYTSIRRQVFLALNPIGSLGILSLIIYSVIVASVILAILSTEESIYGRGRIFFDYAEYFFISVFSIEYIARIWSAPESGVSRLRYAIRPLNIFDLILVIMAILPFVSMDILALRILRIVRVLRALRLARFSQSLSLMERAISSRLSHLSVAFVMTLFAIIVFSTIIYWIEGGIQPEHFGSILRSMWWVVVTMTTVGYGDIVPLSSAGRIFGGFVAMSGIILIAIPTGILAASFSDELEKIREAKED